MTRHDPLAYYDSQNPLDVQAQALSERILILRQKLHRQTRMTYAWLVISAAEAITILALKFHF